MEIEVAQKGNDVGSSVGKLMQRGKRKKRRVVPLREDQIKQITKVDESTGKEKVVEEISLLDSDDEGELDAREAEEEKAKNAIELHDLFQKDAGRKYYKRFTLDGCDYGLGDTVVLRSGDERGNFVGIIESIFCPKTILPVKKEGAKHQLSKPRKKDKYKIKVRWFFQKFDIDDRRQDLKIPRKGFPGVATTNEEVYWSFGQDINDISAVLCPAHIIYCPALTDPQLVELMAATCQNEPNTFFCRYIYDSTRFHHINNYEEDWDTEDERCFEAQALYLRLLQEGVEFPSHAESKSESEDSDFDADADSCTPEPLEESVTAVRKPSLGTMVVEVKRESLPPQKGASSGSDANSDDRRESMNGAVYVLDSDTPLDDDEEAEAEANEEEAVMEQEEQEEEEMKDGDDDENLATNRRKRRAEKEKVTDNGKRRKSADAVMLTDDYIHLESVVRSSPGRATSGSPPLPTSSSSSSPLSSSSSLEVKQKLVHAAKADRKRRKSIEKQALEETEERREVNRRRQQQLDDEMKKLSLKPRKKSIGMSVLIETPDFLPLDTDTTTLPPRCRRRRASQEDADARGEEISFRKKATAGTTTPAGVAASDENSPLDLSDREVDLSADTGTYDKTSEPSGASASAKSAWASTWEPSASGSQSSSDDGSGSGEPSGASASARAKSAWASTWEPSAGGSQSSSADGSGSGEPSGARAQSAWASTWEPSAGGPWSSSADGSGWGNAQGDVPSGGESAGQTGLGATYAMEDSSSSSNHEAYADEDRSRGYGGRGGGGVCYKCNKPGHMARECTEAESGPLPVVGSTCPAKVMSVGKKDGRAFGVFVRPEGCCQDGLVHFTRMLRRRVEPDDEDLLKLVGGVGATVNVKVLDIEEENGKRRLKLSMKDADQQPPNVDASGGGGGDTCFKCGMSGHFSRDCPGVSGEQGFGGSASGGHSSGTTANSAWESAGSIDQHSSNSGGGGTGFPFMHPDRARALGLGLSPASTPLSSSAPSAPPASNFPGGAVGGGYALPAYDQPQQLHQFQQPQQYQPQHITFVMPPAYPQPAPQPHGYQAPQGHNTSWAGRNSSPAPPQPHPQLYPAASSASAAPSSLLSPTLTEEEEAELATVPYDLTTLNQARLGQLTMMQWFRRYRRRFTVAYLKGLLVRVLLNDQGYVGEIVGVVRSEPYYLTSYFEPTSPPEDPAQLAQALNDHTLIRVTFQFMVEIPGVDEGRAYPADAISSNYFSHQEMVHWLLGRKAMRRDPLTLEEIEAKKRIIAKARAKSELPPAAANLHRRHRKNSLGLSSTSSSSSSASPSLGQAVSRSDKGKEKVQEEELEEENGGAAMPMIISSSDVEPEPLSLTMSTTSATSR